MNVSSTNKQRKYLIAIGSPSCSEMGLPRLNKVETDIQRVETLLTHEEQGYTRALTELHIGATSYKIKDMLASWFASPERHNSDCVIIYYAGHASEGREQYSHYLYTVESNNSNVPNTAIETSDLVKCLLPGNKNYPQNILLILDVCYAGQGAANVLVEGLTKNSKASENISFYVIASADSRTEAGDGDFVEAFEKVIQNSDGKSQDVGEFLSLGNLVERINNFLEIQKAKYYTLGLSREIPFFRNRHFLSQDNFESDEHNLKTDCTKTKSSQQIIADLLWSLDYSDQEPVFKNAIKDCKEGAFLVQTDEEKIQRWLVRRLARCVSDFDKAKKYQIRIRSHQMRYDFEAFWQEFKQGKRI